MSGIIHNCGVCGDELFDDMECATCNDSREHERDIIYSRLTNWLFSASCKRVITMGGYDAFIATAERILEDKDVEEGELWGH